MARIYQTRNLIDPSIIQYVGNRADKNLAYSNAQTERNANAVANMIKPLGGLADIGVRAYSTRDLIDKNRPDPLLNAARNEYIWTGNTQPIQNWQNNQIQMWNTLKNAELQQATQKWHSDVQDREKRAGWERGRQNAENMLSYIETALSKDPNNTDLKRQKVQYINDSNYYRTQLGMPTLEKEISQETYINTPTSEQISVSNTEREPTKFNNEEFSKIFNDKLNISVWRDENKKELIKFVDDNIKDRALKELFMAKINNKGVTEEDADRWIEENQSKARVLEIPPEFKDKIEKQTKTYEAEFINTKFIPERTVVKFIRKK